MGQGQSLVSLSRFCLVSVTLDSAVRLPYEAVDVVRRKGDRGTIMQRLRSSLDSSPQYMSWMVQEEVLDCTGLDVWNI